MTGRLCVCVPARNEADRIDILIGALAEQEVRFPIQVALCVNNSDDATAERAAQAAGRSNGRISLTIEVRTFEAGLAHAGSARRAAMDLGAALLSDDDYLLTTDADCRPPADWISANLAAAATDHIIGGRIELDAADPDADPRLLAMRRRFDRYWHEVRAIEDRIDPSPWDTDPRHGDHTGASLMLSVGLYKRAGGVPLLSTGEDRALVEAAMAAGGRLVHPVTVWTRASPRPAGRAEGGMASDMASWSAACGSARSLLVPAYHHWHDRAAWRRARRVAGLDVTLAERALPPMPCDMPLPEATGP